MTWFPELAKNKPMLGKVLVKTQEYVLDSLNSKKEPTEEELKNYITSIYQEPLSFKEMYYYNNNN